MSHHPLSSCSPPWHVRAAETSALRVEPVRETQLGSQRKDKRSFIVNAIRGQEMAEFKNCCPSSNICRQIESEQCAFVKIVITRKINIKCTTLRRNSNPRKQEEQTHSAARIGPPLLHDLGHPTANVHGLNSVMLPQNSTQGGRCPLSSPGFLLLTPMLLRPNAT